MGKFIDLTGIKHGRLTPEQFIRENGKIKWICKCDCGNTTIVSSNCLRMGKTQSCGCLQRERASDSSFKDLTGCKYGRLKVLKRHGKCGEIVKYDCVCDCGNTVVVLGNRLRNGQTKSCGCIHKEGLKKRLTTHGQTGTRIYKCWSNMRERCKNKNNKRYENYGGRGITVCSLWDNSFESFYEWAMSNGYSDDLTLDRIDVNGSYCPENCRWADLNTQSRNRTDNVWITHNGKTMILQDWANFYSTDRRTVSARLKKGWSVEESLEGKK